MTDIFKGNYIRFTTRVIPAVTSTLKAQDGTRHRAVFEPERWAPCSGSGLVTKVNAAPKSIGGVSRYTAKVDAGPWLGNITVAIDDAVVCGVQESLGLEGAFALEQEVTNMYSDGIGA